MDTRLPLHVTAGFAVLSIGTAVAVAVPPTVASPVESDSVALVAQDQPLSPTPVATTLSPPSLIGQQVAFHVAFVTDFLSTGAQLFARELPIPLTLLADLGGGTPLPTAVVRALQDLAAVEVDAGSELLRFGAEYVGFQAQFVTSLILGQPAVATTTAPTPRVVVGSAPRVPTPTSIALTHRSGPPDEASQTVTIRLARLVGTDEPRSGSSGPAIDVGRKDDSHGPDGLRHERPDRASNEGPSSTSGRSDAQKSGHDQHDRHDRKDDGHRQHHD